MKFERRPQAAEGASKGLHYVDERGAKVVSSSTERSASIGSLDVGLLRWGKNFVFVCLLCFGILILCSFLLKSCTLCFCVFVFLCF